MKYYKTNSEEHFNEVLGGLLPGEGLKPGPEWRKEGVWGGTPRARRQRAARGWGQKPVYEKSKALVRARRAQSGVPRFLEVTPRETEVGEWEEEAGRADKWCVLGIGTPVSDRIPILWRVLGSCQNGPQGSPRPGALSPISGSACQNRALYA